MYLFFSLSSSYLIGLARLRRYYVVSIDFDRPRNLQETRSMTHDKEIISLARQSATDRRHTRSGKLDIVRSSSVAKHNTPSSPSGMSRESSADVAASLPIRIANYEVLRLACRFRFVSFFPAPSSRLDRFEVLFPDAASRPLFNLRAARYPAIMKPTVVRTTSF